MPDDARLGDLGRGVDDATDHAGRVDGPGNGPAGIDALDHQIAVGPGTALEVPPRDPVLRRYDRRPRPERAVQLCRDRRDAVGLEPQEDHVGAGDRGDVIGDARVRVEVAVRAQHADPARAHGRQVRAAGDEGDVEPGPGEARTHVAPDGARAEDGEPHRWRPFSREAIRLRCILPVGVRGISLTTWMTFGTLKPASDAPQLARSCAGSASALRTTAAPTTCPYLSSAIPKHTASVTAGCAFSASSTSPGEMFSPPRMISSLIRPSRRRWPSSSRPRSPVRNQPSKKDSAFASASPR